MSQNLLILFFSLKYIQSVNPRETPLQIEAEKVHYVAWGSREGGLQLEGGGRGRPSTGEISSDVKENKEGKEENIEGIGYMVIFVDDFCGDFSFDDFIKEGDISVHESRR